MARIFVTVGMGPWPFDRLIGAIAPLCEDHDVFAQTGTSSVRPPCLYQPFLAADEFGVRIGAGPDLQRPHARFQLLHQPIAGGTNGDRD